jgi:hypothetical protein
MIDVRMIALRLRPIAARRLSLESLWREEHGGRAQASA